jgi:hypothetical protein
MADWSDMRGRSLWLLGLMALAGNPLSAAARTLPERIVMMWQVTGPNYAADFRALANLGVNTVQSFPLARQDSTYVSGYLAAADTAGVGVIPFLGRDGKGAACTLSSAGEAFVRRYASHRAIVAWHSIDEPAGHDISKECQRKVYLQVKALDASRPVMVSTNFTRQQDYDRYFAEDAFDVLELHRYVNPDVSAAQRTLLERFRQNRGRKNYPTIVTLRAFNAPHKSSRRDMRAGGLQQQFSFFFETEYKVDDHIGFYGWRLAPNEGISQMEWLRREFEVLARQKLIPRQRP